MEYLWLKWMHVISATILFGTGIGIAFFKWYADRYLKVSAQAAVLKIVVVADWTFTLPAVVMQLTTGLWMVHLAHFPLDSGWIFWSLILYFFAGACWLPVLWLQLKMRLLANAAAAAGRELPLEYHRYRIAWFWLGVPAFSALVVVFYLMIFKPQ